MSGKKNRKSAAVRDNTGQLISDPNAQRERWGEHFSELLNPPVRDADLSDLDSLEVIPSFPHLSDDDGPPTRTEIFDALQRLKNHKSPGVDDITNEQPKYGALMIKRNPDFWINWKLCSPKCGKQRLCHLTGLKGLW